MVTVKVVGVVFLQLGMCWMSCGLGSSDWAVTLIVFMVVLRVICVCMNFTQCGCDNV